MPLAYVKLTKLPNPGHDTEIQLEKKKRKKEMQLEGVLGRTLPPKALASPTYLVQASDQNSRKELLYTADTGLTNPTRSGL